MTDFSAVPTEGMQAAEVRRVAEAREAVRLAWEAKEAAHAAMKDGHKRGLPCDVQRELSALHWEACEYLHGQTLALLCRLDVAEALGVLPASPCLEVEARLREDHADTEAVAHV